MNRKLAFILIAMVVAVAFVSTLTYAVAGTPPETILIDKAKNKKPGVEFPHKVHAEKFECKDCHHTAKIPDEAESCFNCHGKLPDIPDPGVMSAKENPFHILCKTCHSDLKKEGKVTGPTKCKECHA
jgi:hypothetical protein